MAFIQDPRLRQRWNQLSHNAEAVTENAAAGIWNFQHRYITPCLAAVGDSGTAQIKRFLDGETVLFEEPIY